MGSAKAINFQPTEGGKAAITGDFVLIAKEVNPVLRVLRDHGIEVTAIHNHMLDDQCVNPAELQRDQMIQFANVILAGVIGWVYQAVSSISPRLFLLLCGGIANASGSEASVSLHLEKT
jgi:hypothetical protein